MPRHMCQTQSVCHNPINDLARHMSSHGSLVEHPTSVWKVMGSISIWSSLFFQVLCLYIIVYICYCFNVFKIVGKSTASQITYFNPALKQLLSWQVNFWLPVERLFKGKQNKLKYFKIYFTAKYNLHSFVLVTLKIHCWSNR